MVPITKDMKPMYRCFWLLLLILLLVVPVTAQESTPAVPTEIPEDMPQEAAEILATAQALVATTEARLDSVEVAAQRVEGGVDMAFNLLGLFEAIGFLVTFAAGVAALIGIPRFIAAQNELQAARKRFDEEIDASRDRLVREAAENEAQLNALRADLKQSTRNETLALSFLPLGESQYKSGDFKGALSMYGRALELDGNNPIIRYRMGYVYTQSGQLEEAEKNLKLALDIEKDFAPALAVLGYTYRRMAERMEEGVERHLLNNQAEQLLLRALALSPRLVDDDGESWWGSLGGLYRRRGQIDQAIYAYTKAGEVMPNSSYAFSNLALLYMQKGERENMINTYRKVEQLALGEIQSDADNYWANADWLTASLALNKMDQAERALQAVRTTAPMDSSYALESQMDTMGRLAKALEPAHAQVVQTYIDQLAVFTEEQRKKQQTTEEQEAQTKMKAAQISEQITGD